MKIVMTLLVRDEQDILRANIEFHRAQGVDFFIIMDNLSLDATPAIAQEYVAEGIARYIHQPHDDYAQAEWVTQMARIAYCDHGADWVINNDADEFWWPLRGTLRETFSAIAPEYNALLAQRHNFVPVMEGKSDAPFYARMIYREAVSLNPLGKPLPPKMAHRGSAHVVVAQGNHAVEGMGPVNAVAGLVEVLHFPLRSYQQFHNKIVKGGAAYQRNTSLPKGIGITWRTLYDEHVERAGLPDYYRSHSYDDERLRRELATGALLEDRRLSRFLADRISSDKPRGKG